MSRTKLVVVLAVALATAAALISTAGARTRPAPQGKIDLSTRAKIVQYLLTIGVDPGQMVIQRGTRNYAGPQCPGAHWSCTTSMNVVQVAAAGGTNKFECKPEEARTPATSETTSTCVIVQAGHNNIAQCRLKDNGEPVESQTCDITQDGARNVAVVDELIEQRTGPDQDARQFAHVHQTATGSNELQIHQSVKQDTSMGSAQNQNTHQVALVEQIASGSENLSHVQQDQDLSESGAAGIQNQNVAGLPPGVTDCDTEHKLHSEPNACANVDQNVTASAGGKNESLLQQSINEREKTTALNAQQTQEQFESGIEAHIDQTNPPGVGTNRKVADQEGRQSADGPRGTSQTQIIDPNCCGVGTTIGGGENTDDFHQAAAQSASEAGDAVQILRIKGDTNHEPAPHSGLSAPAIPTASNSCKISHSARNDSASTHFTFTVDPCIGPVSVFTMCESAAVSEGEEGFCTPPPGPGEPGNLRTLRSSPAFVIFPGI